MKIRCTLLTLLLIFVRFAYAQTPDTTSYKHHLGIIASPTLHKVFDSNRELPVGLIYKRQIKANAAFRATLVGTTSMYEHSSPSPNNKSTSENSYFHVQLTGGYEWQVPLSNRWELYYGGEAGPVYGRSVSKNRSGNSDYYNGTTVKDNSYNVGAVVRPFAGIAFQINSRLYIATETAIVAYYHTGKYKTHTASYGNTSDGTSKYSYANIKYQPLSNLSLLLRF
ncbi:hypothetical protein [Pontibacter liquoris]|uniref:hypothetical protein n=1 Tax=Pontibacter liquoris TaxID=2905677 RepID=UPI001FA6E44B|nr:hypothetical protein [Pontibacter liquoris]